MTHRCCRAALIPCLFLGASLQAALLNSFPAGTGGWQLGTLAVGQLNADAPLEIVVPYRAANGQWYLDAFRADGTRLAGFPYAAGQQDMNVSPTLYDLDGDGRAEILFHRANSLVALRGDGTTLWSTQINRTNYIPDAGYQVVPGGFYWSPGTAWITNLPASAAFYAQVSPPLVADVAGNDSLEVLTAWKIDPDTTGGGQDFNPFINDLFGFQEWGTVGESWSGGVVCFDARTGAKRFVYHLHQLVEAGLAVGQADDDAPLETYVLNDSDSVVCFDKSQPVGLYGNGMLHRQFGKNQRLMSGTYLAGVDVYAADIDGDGHAEVLVPTRQIDPLWQPAETILDDDGAILWRQWKQPVAFVNNNGWLNSACMIPCNPDHDNRADVFAFAQSFEISYRYWNGLELVDHAGWPISFAPRLPTPPVVGDVDGDGEEDVVIGTYDPASNPSSGQLLVLNLAGQRKITIDIPGGIKHTPTLADVNADGALDVVFRALDGRVYVHNFGAGKPGAVSWSTHRGNAQRDGFHSRALFPPGTPVITTRESGQRRAAFSWRSAAAGVSGYRIYRAEQADGSFLKIAELSAGTLDYIDAGLRAGWLYFYEVAAVTLAGELRSPPFPVLADLNHNLVANGGFEENDNSHWDKWYTGDLAWTNMVGSGSVAHQGRRSMEIQLLNRDDNSSVKQFNQYGTPDAYLPVEPGATYSFGGFFKSGGLSQASQHWLEWNSSLTGENTNARPALPWPDYFTVPLSLAAAPADWIYANRVFTMPDGFPNVELRHRFTMAAAGSGSVFIDDVFFCTLPVDTDNAWRELIPFGATWRYATNPPAADWFAADFNDALWPQGRAKFGAGSGPQNVVTKLPPKLPVYFFRRAFVVADLNLDELLLRATCTDDYGGVTYPPRIFLNGQEIVTSGIGVATGNGNDVRSYDLAPFLDRLVAGTNTLAVLLTNVWQPSWDNVAFDLNLRSVPYQPPVIPPRFSAARVTPAGVELDLRSASGAVLRVESSDSIPFAWALVATVTNATGALTLTDVGQNGRPPPASVARRYYRAVQP